MSNRNSVILVALVGVVSGVGASLLTARLHEDWKERHDAPGSAVREARAPLTKSQESRLRAIEARVGNLARSSDVLSKPIQTPLDTDPAEVAARKAATDEVAAAEGLTEDEHYEQVMAGWRADLDAFEAEASDPTWANGAGEAFAQDLRQLGIEKHFELVGSDCRTTTCSAQVRFNTHADAVNGYSELLHHSYQMNCAKSATLPNPEPLDEDKPYVVTVLYDCTSLRAEG